MPRSRITLQPSYYSSFTSLVYTKRKKLGFLGVREDETAPTRYYLEMRRVFRDEMLIRIAPHNPILMEFSKLCQKIMALDPKVRFAGICDDTGEILYGGQREDVKDLLTREETRKSNLQAMARWASRYTLASKIGLGKYAMAEYEKIKRITVPLDNEHLLLVTTEVDVDHGRIISSILKLVQE